MKKLEYSSKHKWSSAAYVERNQVIIDVSDFCVFYYDPHMSRHIIDTHKQPAGGTALTYKYAKR